MKKIYPIVISRLLLVVMISINYGNDTENYIISKDGNRIAYSVEGHGFPDIIFVHGWLGDQTSWSNQKKYFSKNHRVITLDLVGFGKSGNKRDKWTMEAFGEDVKLVIEHLNVKKAVLVGHSMGSAVIIEVAMQMPNIIIGLVPVDVFHNVEQNFTPEQIEYEIERRMFLVEDRLIANPSKAEYKTGWIASLAEYFKWRSNSLTINLEALKIPITCINSDRKPSDIEMARKYTSSFDVKIVKGVGHGVMVEKHDLFNRLLTKIISTTSD
ncbi:alpha/beta fold hydrolase [Candidatus Neomarinimicrobiota bacterium]